MKRWIFQCMLTLVGCIAVSTAYCRDLEEIKASHTLRHLGVPYANFITGNGDGLDIELIQGFAAYLGVEDQYVPTTWSTVLSDLVGSKVIVDGKMVVLGEVADVKGDVIANGMTILPWRQQVLSFSQPTFPTQVWLVAAAGVDLSPTKPSASLENDIINTKGLLSGRSVLEVSGTCLDPKLYDLDDIPVKTTLFSGNLNELALAVSNGMADTALLDVPDSLVALARWPGQIKVLGPVTELHYMAVGFRKDAPALQKAFDQFLTGLWNSGAYAELVRN